jgi:ABC-type ATPase involved in cell division
VALNCLHISDIGYIYNIMNGIQLTKLTEPLVCSVERDEFIEASEIAFDCLFDGTSRFYGWSLPDATKLNKFSIGVIVGTSGSGKSTLLKQFGEENVITWSADKAIVSHFSNPEDAIDKLSAVGLNSVPSWYKPYHVLSTGEKFRADLARKLRDGAVIDEFTSVVDRNVAKAASVAMSKHIKRTGLSNIVIATCHRDILDWLEPDWVIDTDTGHMYDGFFLSDRKYSWRSIEQIERYGQCLKTIII